MGSGTALFVSQRMKRHSLGIDIIPEYYDLVNKQLKRVELILFDPKQNYENPESE